MLSMIFACDENGAIGKGGDLPWRQSTDLKHFKQTTLNKVVVMGRKTWESLGRPLPHRRNVVMTRQGVEAEVETMSFDEVMALSDEDDVMIIGGGEIYALFLPYAKEIHRTVIHTVVEDADTYAPAIDADEFYLLTERRVEPGERDEHAMTFQHWIA
ncbi:MAG: dihydrofolate reductase [Candidatus Thermoplasmatota archaeon]|nr:dihydrofolate reductase [Candidatus Thermoplasmatota archaeon]GIR76111.1 MAG: dihydrofolate reductase [Candidatus Poseidoniales archaeon]MEC7443650.1 dihydrofolate reductase [Candidatus Thermoplasmatota archaeon]MEC7504519.1 dihydrofolate reductase [Candidatus Thermoplasmatota archaeon]MEC7600491.1 dihydrofolate reductase [Candidatus Thermoplasmatota archaeon]